MKIIEPSIVEIGPKKLLGKHAITSFKEDTTSMLWQSFMPFLNQIQHKTNKDLYSLQIFPDDFFLSFNPTTTYAKWALVEVDNYDILPENMKPFLLAGGLYAVFNHKGMDTSIFQYIYSTWVPGSIYKLDDRPHFEVLGNKYKQGSPPSEEEIWIPIALK